MGRLFVIEYDRTPDVRFYMCRYCKTHIAMDHEYILTHPTLNWFGIFENLVNVVTETGSTDDGSQENVHCSLENVHCVCCNAKLGWKLVNVLTTTNVMKEGRYVISLLKLLLWNGNRVVDGYYLLPVIEPRQVQEPEGADEDASGLWTDDRWIRMNYQPPANVNPVQEPEDADEDVPEFWNAEWRLNENEEDIDEPNEAPANVNAMQAPDEDASVPMESPEFEDAEGQPPGNANPVQAHDEDAEELIEGPEMENAEGQAPANVNPMQAHDGDAEEPIEAPDLFENAEDQHL